MTVRVSVVTPTYDRADVIGAAIDSVANQTYDDVEHLVVDDASEDDTAAVVREHDHDRLRFLPLETNRGANYARNEGIRATEGEYVCFLDSDDRLAPTFLERCVAALEGADPDVGGVYTSKKLVRDGELFSYNIAAERTTYDDIVRSNAIGGFSGTMFRASVFDEVGLLDTAFESSQDYEFYLRALERYEMRGIAEALVVRDYTSEERISRDVERKRAGFERLLEKHGASLERERRAQQAFSEAMYHGENGEMDRAIALLRKSLSMDRSRYTAYPLLAASYAGQRPFVACLRTLQALRKRATRLQYWWTVGRMLE